MPLFDGFLTVESCENVAFIRPVEGRHWPLRFSCSTCREESPNYIFVDPTETADTAGGGVRNCVVQCKGCKATISAEVMPLPNPGYDADSGKDGLVLQVNVRGGEPVELCLDDQWTVETTSGATFSAVDLAEDWSEFDEGSQVPLMVSGAAINFKKAAKKK